MAYSSIAQSEELASAKTPSPEISELPYTPLDLAFEELSSTLFGKGTASFSRPGSSSKVGGILTSLTSSSKHSYGLVEEDDYEQPQETPRLGKTFSQEKSGLPQMSATEEVPVRTASISRHLPLNHPTPDLQSLQGAYVKNVERLEERAERLSLASSLDDDRERTKSTTHREDGLTRKVSAHERRFSSASKSNSIISVNATARNGGYSPAGYVGSAGNSIRSIQREQSKRDSRKRTSCLSNPLPEPEQEGRPLDSPMAQSPPTLQGESDDRRSISESIPDRPPTSASNDTYRQAQELFTDFDGIHYTPEGDRASRRISLTRPPRARDSKAFKEQQPGESMIYYPAPVPVMLNLPVRLSKNTWTERDKKKLQVLKSMPEENRKSVAWIADADSEPERAPSFARKLPPQLRASAFFDKPGSQQDVQLQNGSAGQTLDSILDAAAFAPVSAFTDHPIVGHLGDEVYGKARNSHGTRLSEDKKSKRRGSLSTMLRRGSNEDISEGDDAEKSTRHEGEEHSGDEEDSEDDESNDGQSHQLGFLGAPTTLLAELQLRKEQQKQRNRTAADAFPGGMHSTLLELDAVTQLQQKSRKTKHITLAWEDHTAADKQNFDDEDVPLGVLFPEKEQVARANHNRPLGLMEKKELEENEPLSSRRARLMGVNPSQMSLPLKPRTPEPEEPRPHLNVPILQTEQDEAAENDEEETLAQRMKRMKQKKEHRASFAEDVASSLGLNQSEPEEAKAAEVEETLGQRRRRLQQEALQAGGGVAGMPNGYNIPGIKPRIDTGLAGLLRANPAAGRQFSIEQRDSLDSRRDNIPLSQLRREQSNSNLMSTQFPAQPLLGYDFQAGPTPYLMNGLAPNRFAGYANGMQGVDMMNAMNTGGIGASHPYGMNMGIGNAQQYADAMGMGPPLTPQQRAKIDSWRQGVM